MPIAAIYARVSSDKQREEGTIASQTAALIGFARSHGYQVPTGWVFEDEGYSGASSRPSASGGGAHPAPSASAIVRLPAAPPLPLPPAGLDAVAPALAGKPQVRPGGTSHCAGRLYRGRRGSDGTARPTGGAYRSRVARVVSRTGG